MSGSGAGRAMDGPAVVSVRAATRRFGAVRALSDVTLAVAPGEAIGLVGHNGAGKSTLVNLMTGALPPSEGAVAFDGAGAAEAGVRCVSQELALAPNLTVAENLRIVQGDLRGLRWRAVARDRIRAALDAVFPGHGIDADDGLADLSLPARQMAEIAMAFAAGPVPPGLAILDEPTSALDARRAAQLVAHVDRFRAGGGAAVFISHVLPEVLSVATRIVVASAA